MIGGVTSLDVLDYFRSRKDKYKEKIEAAKNAIENPGNVENSRLSLTLLEDLLLMMAEDNVVVLEVRLDKLIYTSLGQQTTAFADFLDQQRFIVKPLFDYYTKMY